MLTASPATGTNSGKRSRESRMKTRAAVLWEAPGKWQVQEVDLDDPGPGSVT
jgi:hypothetical protein